MKNKTAATARREAKEETGYSVFAKKFIGRFTHNDGGQCDYYECDLDVTKPKPSAYDEFETEDVKWVTLVEALELLNDDVDVKILSVANNLVPQLLIKGGHTGTMVALKLPKAIAKQIAIKGGEPVSSMHITLAYLGKNLSESQKKVALTCVRRIAALGNGLKFTLGGVGRFSASATSEGKDVVYISVDSPALTKLRPLLVKMLEAEDVHVSQEHGFVPHVTLAYIDKKAKTPIERFEPIEVDSKDISFVTGGKWMNLPLKKSEQTIQRRSLLFKMYGVDLGKALPRLSDEQRAEKTKKVGTKPSTATKKQAGATGKTRYTYPGESGGAKPKQQEQGAPPIAEEQASGEGQQEQKELPHPDLPSPAPEQAPIAAEHPEKPNPNDPRGPDPTKVATPKHTLNVGELCAAINVSRATLMTIVSKTGNRQQFVKFMSTRLNQFSDEHGLEGDYFGLLWDVLTGKVPEAQADGQQQDVAKKTKPSV